MELEGKNVIVTLSIGANSTITLAKWVNVAADFGKLNVEADGDNIRFGSLRCYGFTRRSPNTFALVYNEANVVREISLTVSESM